MVGLMRTINLLRSLGFRVQVWVRRRGRPKKGNLLPPTPVLGIDAGANLGVCIGCNRWVVLGYAHKPDNDDLALTVHTIIKRLKPTVVGIETAYCPAYETIVKTGVIYGAVVLVEPKPQVVWVLPHRKPSFTTIKRPTDRRDAFFDHITRWFEMVANDIHHAGHQQHPVSAYGVVLSVCGGTKTPHQSSKGVKG